MIDDVPSTPKFAPVMTMSEFEGAVGPFDGVISLMTGGAYEYRMSPVQFINPDETFLPVTIIGTDTITGSSLPVPGLTVHNTDDADHEDTLHGLLFTHTTPTFEPKSVKYYYYSITTQR